MAGAFAFLVSNRLRRPFVALVCLVAAQALLGLASCQPEPTPMAAKVGHP
jgi:hypothetical protein